jgi:predicted nuclease with RNAse H fold
MPADVRQCCEAVNVRVIAIDWSGKEKNAAEFIWLAEVVDGRLVDLRNGLGRDQVIDHVASIDGPVVVGLDFAFSFPRWWCEEQGWRTVREVWAETRDHGDGWLSECADPFWGRTTKRPHERSRGVRRTERGGSAKSVFQIGGAGAVGTGSVRGMPHLLSLAAAGFSVWPFDAPGPRTVIEIYPRALTGRVNKGRWSERHAALLRSWPEQDRALLERAAGSEDAFDAAVSALVMGRHVDELAALRQTEDPDHLIEGCIWLPASLR